MNKGDYAGFTSMYSLEKYRQSTINVKDLFLFLIQRRWLESLFLWFGSFSGTGRILFSGCVTWYAFSGGMLLALFLLKYGRGGIGIFFCMILPQSMVYYQVFGRCYKNAKCSKKGILIELRTLLSILAIAVLGCILETAVGKWVFGIVVEKI